MVQRLTDTSGTDIGEGGGPCHQGRRDLFCCSLLAFLGADGLEHGQPAAGGGAVQLLREGGVLVRGRRPRERHRRRRWWRRLHRLGLGLMRAPRAWPGRRDGDPGQREVGRRWPHGDGGVGVRADGSRRSDEEGGTLQRRREEVWVDGAPLHVGGTGAEPATALQYNLHGHERKTFYYMGLSCHCRRGIQEIMGPDPLPFPPESQRCTVICEGVALQ
jgi:hypothetical protein